MASSRSTISPIKIAESRDHPHEDAIHAAGWVSLFTLHALWPFLWIWAMAYRPERGWGFSHPGRMVPHPRRIPASSRICAAGSRSWKAN